MFIYIFYYEAENIYSFKWHWQLIHFLKYDKSFQVKVKLKTKVFDNYIIKSCNASVSVLDIFVF